MMNKPEKSEKKAWIQTTPDFDYEVIDVYLVIKQGKRLLHLQGFDETEWEEAKKFAEEIAEVLGIEYIGEVGEANHEVEWTDEN